MVKANTKTLEDLFHDSLKDIYFAEKKILVALPKWRRLPRTRISRPHSRNMSPNRGSGGAARAGVRGDPRQASGKACPAIVGIIEEGQEIMKEYKGSPALDAGLLAAAQAVEHYEIFGTEHS